MHYTLPVEYASTSFATISATLVKARPGKILFSASAEHMHSQMYERHESSIVLYVLQDTGNFTHGLFCFECIRTNAGENER